MRGCREADAVPSTAAEGHPPLEMGIGIHSGKVIAGNIGAPSRVNYTLVGDAVNLAQRLEQLSKPLAKPGDAVTILISRQVTDALDGQFVTEELGTHSIRGRVASLEVFRL